MLITQSNPSLRRDGANNAPIHNFTFNHSAATSDFAICSVCGEHHPVEYIEFAFMKPDVIVTLPELEMERRCNLDNSLCVLRGESQSENIYFIRGVLPLPVQGWPDPYNLGVWVAVPKFSFYRVLELWDQDDQASEPPFPGQLANAIPFHTKTLGLKVNVCLTGPTTCPGFHVSEYSHKLHAEQLHGISAHQAHEYTRLVV